MKFLDTEVERQAVAGNSLGVKFLILLGGNPNAVSSDGFNTPLIRASKWGDPKFVKTLIEAGVNLDWTNSNGENALMLAARYGHDKVVKTLIDAGVGVDLIDQYGQSALILAARYGHDKVVKTLIDAGAGVDLIDQNGESALILATAKGHAEVVNSLIVARANADLTSKNGLNALILAAQKGHVEIFNSLLKAGANVDLVRRNGLIPFIHAIEEGHAEVINSLIVAGVDFNLVIRGGFYDGKTAIEAVAISPNVDENKKQKIFSKLFEVGAILRPEFLSDDAISVNMKDFAKKHDTTEKIKEREENLLKNTNLQDAFKESILAGKPITFRDNVVDKVLLNALRSITQKDLDEAGKENIIKLRRSGVYSLLKIEKHLSEDEFSLAAKNLKDFKNISDKAPFLRSSDKFGVDMDSGDIMSKILMHSLMPNSLGEALTLKITNQIKILTAPASRSNPSLNSDGASASPLDSQQISAQAPTARPSAPFGESPPINPVVTADLVFVSGGFAKPSNPHQPPPQASTINPSPHVAKSTQRAEPVVTAQPTSAPVQVADENSSNSPRGVGPGFVQR